MKICYFLFFIFLRVFRSQVLQNLFRVFLLTLSFEVMQDICRRPASFVEIQSWYLIQSPPPPHTHKRTQRWVTINKIFFFQFGDLCYFFFQHIYVPIIRQKVENLVIVFEIRSNLGNSCSFTSVIFRVSAVIYL